MEDSNERSVAIILARGGSKRLPKKNILDFKGKPLIAWTIEAAKMSEYITNVVVSSDSDEILEVAEKYGVICYRRSKENASDNASSIDALNEVLLEFGDQYDNLVLLQPTSPLRNNRHIDEAFEVFNFNHAKCVISVCEMEHSPLWSNKLPDNGSMEKFIDVNVIGKRSQDLPTYYHLNGAIYICNINVFKQYKGFPYIKETFAYQMDKFSSIDIDTEFEFKIAEFIAEL